MYVSSLIESFYKVEDHTILLDIGRISEHQNILLDEEENLAPHGEGARRYEFIAGRNIARKLCGKLLGGQTAILRDKYGCPKWPIGLVGSISHKLKLAAVMVSLEKHCDSIGCDLEVKESLEEKVWSVFMTESEVKHLDSLGLDKDEFSNILFSSKEALFKCLHPIYRDDTPPISELPIKFEIQEQRLRCFFSYEQRMFRGGVIMVDRMILSWWLAIQGSKIVC
ncbi:MAG: 4'-phosphopantetheinyl transferase superfamily protein [Kangiellaceae bacterium]|nr:4'-phosphopantetheinyl transferase superfamily protein [Kangiellaceae bacterium]MCW9015821.1 4'-phosphopantetheinyl transferase superfamily protein [Kangiellaceae bacterium]